MPTQQRPRRHEQDGVRLPRQMSGYSGQHRPINNRQLWPRSLAAQNLELVTQQKQFDVFRIQAPAAPNKRPEQRSKREVERRRPGHRPTQRPRQ